MGAAYKNWLCVTAPSLPNPGIQDLPEGWGRLIVQFLDQVTAGFNEINN